MNPNIEIQVVSSHNITNYEEVGKKFNSGANVIAYLFENNLEFKMKGLNKIRVELQNENSQHETGVFLPAKLTPRVFIRKSFNFDHYFAQPKPERRKIILETLYESIVAMCEKAGYDLAPFTAAYEKVKELNYENRFIYGKIKSSPNRKMKAGIEIEVTEEVATISAYIQLSGKVERITLLKTIPHYLFIYRFIHKGKWTDSNTFVVSNKSGEVNFVVSLSDKSVKTVFEPKNNTVDELKQLLNENTIEWPVMV